MQINAYLQQVSIAGMIRSSFLNILREKGKILNENISLIGFSTFNYMIQGFASSSFDNNRTSVLVT